MLHHLIDFIHSLTDPDRLKLFLVDWKAYALLFFVIFAESGLLVGFFLPGDSLLFTVGIVAGAGHVRIAPMIALLAFASMLGDGVGFLIGSTAGYSLFQRGDSKIFRREYVDRTQAFYEKHGGKTILYAKFVPIIRTFAAFVAGVGKMRYGRFLAFNVFGAIGWVTLMIAAGNLLGGVPFVRAHFEMVVLAIIVVSILPVLVQLIQSRRASAKIA